MAGRLSDYEYGYLPLRPTVYEAEDGELHAFPHDYGPEYEEKVCLGFDDLQAVALDQPLPVLWATRHWRRLEHDPDD